MAESKAKNKEVKAAAKKQEETQQAKPEKKNGFAAKSVPAYIAVLLLVVGALGGYTVGYQNQPPVKIDLVPDQQPEEKNVSAILVYDSTCAICDPVHSLLSLMGINKINAIVKSVDGKSPEGITLIRQYDLNILPTLLLKENTLDNSMLLKTQDGSVALKNAALSAGEQKGEVIVVEEKKLDGKPRILVIADPPCTQLSKNPFVEVFLDPYDPFSIQATPVLSGLHERFKNTPIIYNYANSYSTLLASIHGAEKTGMLVNYLTCAADQNKQKFFDFRQCYLLKYCDKDSDGNLQDGEISTCYEDNPHFQRPLDEAEINSCVDATALDRDKLQECLGGISGMLENQRMKRQSFFVNETPLAVINCKYIVPIKDIEKTVCFMKPDVLGCVG